MSLAHAQTEVTPFPEVSPGNVVGHGERRGPHRATPASATPHHPVSLCCFREFTTIGRICCCFPAFICRRPRCTRSGDLGVDASRCCSSAFRSPQDTCSAGLETIWGRAPSSGGTLPLVLYFTVKGAVTADLVWTMRSSAGAPGAAGGRLQAVSSQPLGAPPTEFPCL